MRATVFLILITAASKISAGQNELTCKNSSSEEGGERKINLETNMFITIGSTRYPIMYMADFDKIAPEDVPIWNSGVISFKSGDQTPYELSGLKLYRNVVFVGTARAITIAALHEKGFTEYEQHVTFEGTKYLMFMAPVGVEPSSIQFSEPNNMIYFAAFLH